MSATTKLRNALSMLEDARRHIKRAKRDAPEIADLRRALREINEAVEELERAIREVED
jgi:uncharacterized protein YukE